METSPLSNPKHTIINLEDQTHEKIAKAKSILTCVMFSTGFVRNEMELDNNTLYHALCAIDEYLDELNLLFQQLMSVRPSVS